MVKKKNLKKPCIYILQFTTIFHIYKIEEMKNIVRLQYWSKLLYYHCRRRQLSCQVLLVLRQALGSFITGLRKSMLKPRDWTHGREATITILYTWLGYLPVNFWWSFLRLLLFFLLFLVGGRGPTRRCCSLPERSPALYSVEFWKVWVKINPN